MLVLTRKPGEKIIVGNQYQIEIAAVQRGKVKFIFSVNQPLTLMPGNIDLDVAGDNELTQLTVTRTVDDSVIIGTDPEKQVEILVVSVKGEAVRVGVKAPREVTVHREEVWRMIEEENIAAAQAPDVDTEEIQKLLAKKPTASSGSKGIDKPEADPADNTDDDKAESSNDLPSR
jgi:carbon storage regulator